MLPFSQVFAQGPCFRPFSSVRLRSPCGCAIAVAHSRIRMNGSIDRWSMGITKVRGPIGGSSNVNARECPIDLRYLCRLPRNMKFFIDTASLAQIKEAQQLGVLDGVTTNPSLMAKEGISGEEAVEKHYKDICSIVDGDVSAEVIATDLRTMVKEGERLASLHPNIVVKVPMTRDGV